MTEMSDKLKRWATRQWRDFTAGSWTIGRAAAFALALTGLGLLLLIILPIAPFLMWLDSRSSDRAIEGNQLIDCS